MNSLSPDEIKSLALARLGEIADALAPDGAFRDRHRRWSLNPTRADANPGSFCLDMSGATAGRFYEFAGAQGGDLIDFVSYCLSGGVGYQTREARGIALQWLRAFLGLADLSPAARALIAAKQDEARARAQAAEHQSKQERERRAKAARDAWLAARPWAGTRVETYLCARLGVGAADLASIGPLGAIRYEAEALDPSTGELLPAMITAMVNDKGAITGVHRTYLSMDGRAKADVSPAKRMFGIARGTIMKLGRGASNLSDKAAEAAGWRDVLAVSEGIEDALSMALMVPDLRTAAAGSVSAMGEIPVGEQIEKVCVLADNDPEGAAASQALDRAVERLAQRMGERARPPRVEVHRPPDAHKDFNDWWRSM